jgi:hypothetical protein
MYVYIYNYIYICILHIPFVYNYHDISVLRFVWRHPHVFRPIDAIYRGIGGMDLMALYTRCGDTAVTFESVRDPKFDKNFAFLRMISQALAWIFAPRIVGLLPSRKGWKDEKVLLASSWHKYGIARDKHFNTTNSGSFARPLNRHHSSYLYCLIWLTHVKTIINQ